MGYSGTFYNFSKFYGISRKFYNFGDSIYKLEYSRNIKKFQNSKTIPNFFQNPFFLENSVKLNFFKFPKNNTSHKNLSMKKTV